MSAPNLAAHRRRIRRRMTATIEASYPGPTVYDPELGYSVATRVVVWSGPAHVRPTPTQARVVEAAGEAVSLRTYDVWLPVDAVTAVEGKPVTVKVTGSSGDPRFPGMVLTILDRPLDDWQTARRLVCQTAA